MDSLMVAKDIKQPAFKRHAGKEAARGQKKLLGSGIGAPAATRNPILQEIQSRDPAWQIGSANV
jgi:hypothetical protein